MIEAPSVAVDTVLRRGAARVTQINAVTRDEIQGIIATAVANDIPLAQVADALERGADLQPLIGRSGGVVGDLRYRSEMIARTEMMQAYNAATLASYGEAGVEHVIAIDGDGDEECAARNGQSFTRDEADTIEDHPNGTLDWVPDFDRMGTTTQSEPDFTSGDIIAPEPLPETVAAPVPVVPATDLGTAGRAAQDAWQAEHYGAAWKDALTPGQLGTLEDYTGEQGYAYVNSYLRGFYEPKDYYHDFFGPKMSKEALDNYAARMDAALALEPLPTEMKLYRSLSIDWEEETSPITTLFGNAPNSLLVGRSGIDPGFISTSLRADINSIIEGEYRMELTVPKGTPAAGLASITKHPDESEILLGRNLRFTITGVHEEGSVTVIEATVSQP